MFSCVSSAVVPQQHQQQQQARYVDSQANVSHLQNATVAFVSTDSEGDTSIFCSGFYVNEDTIVSAAHCFERSPIPMFPQLVAPGRVGQRFAFRTYEQFRNGNNRVAGPTNEASIVAVNSNLDLVVLHTVTPPREHLTISYELPEVGSTVFSMGHPAGLPWMLSNGMVGSIFRTSRNEPEGIMCALPIYLGFSGGPVINNNGEVVGVVGAMLHRGSGMALAYPIANVARIYSGLNPPSRL